MGKRIVRDRRLTPEEAAFYEEIRKEIAAELAEIKQRARKLRERLQERQQSDPESA